MRTLAGFTADQEWEQIHDRAKTVGDCGGRLRADVCGSRVVRRRSVHAVDPANGWELVQAMH